MRKKQRTDRMMKEKCVLTAGLLSASLILGLGGCTPGGGGSTQEDPSNSVTTPSGEEESTGETSVEKSGITYLGTSPKTTVDQGLDVLRFDYTWEAGEVTVLPYQSKFLIVETPQMLGGDGEPPLDFGEGMPEDYDEPGADEPGANAQGESENGSDDLGADDPGAGNADEGSSGNPDGAGISDGDAQSSSEEKAAMVRFLDIETGEMYGKKFSDLTVLTERTWVFDDGSIGLAGQGPCSFHWLNPDLEETGSFDFEAWKAANPAYENVGMYRIDLRTDRKGGYFIWNDSIYYLDMETGTLTELKLDVDAPDGVYISGIYYDNKVLELLGYNGSRVTFYEYDISTPEKPVLEELSRIDTLLSTEDQSYVGMYLNTDFDERLIISGTYKDPEMVWCEAPENFTWGTGCLAGDGVVSYSMNNDQTFTYVDLKEAKVTSKAMAPYFEGSGFSTFYGGLKIGGFEGYVVYRDEKGTSSDIYLIDMDTNVEDLGSLAMHHVVREDYSDEEFIRLTGITDPDTYAVDVLKMKFESMDEYAQEMSARHGVQVVYGEAVEEYNDIVSDFEITTLVPDEGTWGTLAKLDRILSNYPEDFFEQLHTDMTPNGLVICLAAGLTGKDTDASVSSADGLASGDFNQHLVYLNAYSASFEQNVYHEISHIIDNYIENYKFTVADDLFFTEDTWNSCNPEGFSYEENYGSYNDAEEGLGSEYNVYGYQNGKIGVDDVYFIDYYATLYATEDRARIMEYACTFKNEDYMQSPHIQEKVRYMSEYIRHYFDDSTWPEVLIWEKCLSKTQ